MPLISTLRSPFELLAGLDTQCLGGAAGSGFFGLLLESGRHAVAFQIYQTVFIGLEDFRTQLHADSITAATLPVCEGTQCALRCSIPLSHCAPQLLAKYAHNQQFCHDLAMPILTGCT